MTSEQITNHFKIGLANLEDDEDVTKEHDKRTVREQLIQEQTEVLDQTEQLVNQDQPAVPNPAVPRNEQTDLVEAEQNNNQVSELNKCSHKRICAQTLEISKMSST